MQMENLTQIKLVIPGTPTAKGRPKFRRIGSYVQTYTPSKTIKAEKEIARRLVELYPESDNFFIIRYGASAFGANKTKQNINTRRKNGTDKVIGRKNNSNKPTIRELDNEHSFSGERICNIREQAKQFGISLECKFFIAIPNSYTKRKREQLNGQLCLKKPDIDNYIKLVMDALNGIAWEDDNAVAKVHAVKMYDNEPRTEVYINYLQK